jgi:hypothetical protein
MTRLRRLGGDEWLAAIAGAFFSFLLATFAVLVVGIGFVGTRTTGFDRFASVTVGFELPLYAIMFFVSCRLLMYVCWTMYGVVYIEMCVSLFMDQSSQKESLTLKVMDVIAVNLDPRVFLSLAVASLATYLFREEKARRWRLGE